MIQASHLVKWYGPTLAVDDLTFEIQPGQIVGFLGPNGAGKSTAIRILTGYLPPTAGSAAIDGHDVIRHSADARAKIGYLPESTPLYPEMRVEQYLDYRGRMFRMPRTQRRQRIGVVCERCGLAHLRRRLVGQLSRGNKQRVGIAQALLNEPPVLILDEPTAGLDPTQITEVRKLITELRGKHTVLLSSHILPEIEKTADRVMIIANGRMVADGSPDELRRRASVGARVLVEVKADHTEVASLVKPIDGVAKVETQTHDGWCRAAVTPKGAADVREPITAALVKRGYAIRELRHETASLEEFFVQITDPQRQAEHATVEAGT